MAGLQADQISFSSRITCVMDERMFSQIAGSGPRPRRARKQVSPDSPVPRFLLGGYSG